MKRLIIAIGLLFAMVAPAHAYLCTPSTWNPSLHPWPGDMSGYCVWEPYPNTPHPNVQGCQAGGPGWGFLYLYSDLNYGGSCAAVWTYGGYGGPVTLNADFLFVESNGWIRWVVAGGGGMSPLVSIRSAKLGPGVASWGGTYTGVTFSSGPAVGAPGGYSSCTYTNTTTSIQGFPDIQGVCGQHTTLTSFALSAQ